MRTCAVCGFSAIGLDQCPACGSPYEQQASSPADRQVPSAGLEIDARDVTIDVEVVNDRD
ncbi:hypothetical protein [Synechococcus sp. GFB01]|nr:hypothetical protein [Synechococcus sp. GFB01]